MCGDPGVPVVARHGKLEQRQEQDNATTQYQAMVGQHVLDFQLENLHAQVIRVMGLSLI